MQQQSAILSRNIINPQQQRADDTDDDDELAEGRRIKKTKRRRLRHCRNARRIDSDTEDEDAGKYIDNEGDAYEYQELSD